MAETRKKTAPQEPFIVGTEYDAVNSFIELDQTQSQQGSPMENALQGFSPQLVSNGATVPTGFSLGGHSPAWSLSSSNGDSSSGPRSPHVDNMFPALQLGLHADASLNDWLEQFVNADAFAGQSLATLTPDMLSVLSGLCPADVAPAANIAPQQTLSKPIISAENAQKSSSECKNEVVGVSKASNGKANGKRPHMVPLAPRQSTGSTTPPGLGVLAKTAQDQPPIEVKQRPIAQAHSPARKQAKSPPKQPSGDAAAQKRQERLIKNRAAALLSRKRKREYLTKLESEVEELRDANATMAQRMAEMERKMNEMAQERDQLRRAAATAAAQSNSATTSTASSQPKQIGSNQPANSEKPDKPATDSTDNSNHHQQQQQQQPSQQQMNKRQRTAGALLMAMLFSFSLFTLPSLYPSDSQITAGGMQSAGKLPSSPPRLLLPAASEHPEPEHPLVERVRRSISAFAQQQQSSRLEDDEPQARAANTSAEADIVRPLTMEQSADLHAWIRRGLKAGENTHEQATALAVVDQRASRQLDHAMLYCPSMKHVMFSSDERQVIEVQHDGSRDQAGSARVLDATGSSRQISMEDVDEAIEIQASPRVERSTASRDVSLLIPTHDAASAALPVRPKLSLYSPVVTSNAEANQHILPPWEEYARLSDASDSVRQKYLRIDVEVVGSKWVTAEKFANGLY